MARCPNCDSAVLPDALICATCDEPLQHKDKLLLAYAMADRAAEIGLERPAIGTISLICPHCKAQSSLDVPHDGWFDVTCTRCRRSYRTLLATVRGKRSRGSRRFGARDYSVRVRHSGVVEELIEYGQSGYGDFELRSSDIVAFSYVGRTLIVTQNLTIRKHNVNNTTWGEILQGTAGLLVICGVIWWFFFRH